MLADLRPTALLAPIAPTTVLAESRPTALLALRAYTTVPADFRPTALLAPRALTTVLAESRPTAVLALSAPTTVLADSRPSAVLAVRALTTVRASAAHLTLRPIYHPVLAWPLCPWGPLPLRPLVRRVLRHPHLDVHIREHPTHVRPPNRWHPPPRPVQVIPKCPAGRRPFETKFGLVCELRAIFPKQRSFIYASTFHHRDCFSCIDPTVNEPYQTTSHRKSSARQPLIRRGFQRPTDRSVAHSPLPTPRNTHRRTHRQSTAIPETHTRTE